MGLFPVPPSSRGAAWLVGAPPDLKDGHGGYVKGVAVAELGHSGWVAHIRTPEEKEVEGKEGRLEARGCHLYSDLRPYGY